MHAINAGGMWYSAGWMAMMLFWALMMIDFLYGAKLVLACSRTRARKTSHEKTIRKYASGEMPSDENRYGAGAVSGKSRTTTPD